MNDGNRSWTAQTALFIKLKNILKNVTKQESILQNKTKQIEQWYNMHQSALSNACKIKHKLINFKRIDESKCDATAKQQQTQNKNEINLALDELTKELKHLNESEVKFRSIECTQELKT